MVKSGYLASVLLVVFILPVSDVFAQGCPFCPDGEHECTDVDDDCAAGKNEIPIPDPPPPPCADDRTFVWDSGTGCMDGAGHGEGPWNQDIIVDRYLGPTNNLPGQHYGFLANVEEYFDAPLLGRWARLTIMAWDVDNRGGSECYTPEVDYVYFNDIPMRQLWPGNPSILRGRNQAWSVNHFTIPIEFVNFPDNAGAAADPELGSPATAPPAAENKVRIEIDATEQCWCVGIGWMMLEIQATSPVVLLHGHGESHVFWDDEPITFKQGLADEPFVVDSASDHGSDSIAGSGADIASHLSNVAVQYGVDSVHLVAHSKGGLDSLYYLANDYDHDEGGPVEVLSLTTLSSPLRGSVMADIVVARDRMVQAQFENLNDVTAGLVEWVGLFLIGREDQLTTDYVSSFMHRTAPKLPMAVEYNTIGADLDMNEDGHLSCPPEPDEGASIREWFGFLEEPVYCELWQTLLDPVYLTMRHKYKAKYRIVPPWTVIVTGYDCAPRMNDILVTVQSSYGPKVFWERARRCTYAAGAHGKTHASVADAEVGRAIIPWIIEREESAGDMRPLPLGWLECPE